MLKIIAVYHYNTHAWLLFTMWVVKIQYIAGHGVAAELVKWGVIVNFARLPAATPQCEK